MNVNVAKLNAMARLPVNAVGASILNASMWRTLSRIAPANKSKVFRLVGVDRD